MRRLLVLAGLLLMFGGMVAQAQDEAPGQQVQITVPVASGGFSCGRHSYPLYCYGVPTNVGGTFWMDIYSVQQNGFILFNDVLDLGMGTVTKVTNTAEGIQVEFHGFTNDGDNDPYTGIGVFTFSSIKMKTGSGRGGGYPGYILMLRSGSITITYN